MLQGRIINIESILNTVLDGSLRNPNVNTRTIGHSAYMSMEMYRYNQAKHCVTLDCPVRFYHDTIEDHSLVIRPVFFCRRYVYAKFSKLLPTVS
jgi:hypothetical protein